MAVFTVPAIAVGILPVFTGNTRWKTASETNSPLRSYSTIDIPKDGSPAGLGKIRRKPVVSALSTLTTRSALEESSPSLTVIRSVYVPAALKDTSVDAACGAAKDTPLPATALH